MRALACRLGSGRIRKACQTGVNSEEPGTLPRSSGIVRATTLGAALDLSESRGARHLSKGWLKQ